MTRTTCEWFEAAEAAYSHDHQACPSCTERHCVFRSRWGTRVEYHCTLCDFSAGRDESDGRPSATPGGSVSLVPACLR